MYNYTTNQTRYTVSWNYTSTVSRLWLRYRSTAATKSTRWGMLPHELIINGVAVCESYYYLKCVSIFTCSTITIMFIKWLIGPMPIVLWSLRINVIISHLFAWNTNISVICHYMRHVEYNNLKKDKGTRTGFEQRNKNQEGKNEKKYISIKSTMSKIHTISIFCYQIYTFWHE